LLVTATDGFVTITGTTRSMAVEEAVPMVARQVDGVEEVQSKVEFIPAYPPGT